MSAEEAVLISNEVLAALAPHMSVGQLNNLAKDISDAVLRGAERHAQWRQEQETNMFSNRRRT